MEQEKIDKIEYFDYFSSSLRKILKRNKIKQTDLAKAIGIDNQTISNWLDKKNKYRPQWIMYINKLNDYLFIKAGTYDPLELFFRDYLKRKSLLKEKEKDLAERISKFEKEKAVFNERKRDLNYIFYNSRDQKDSKLKI